MAITAIREPDDIMPIYNPMMFLLDSTLSSNTGFKYVFKISVGLETRNVRISPRPSDGNGEFDIAAHLRDYIDVFGFDILHSGNSTSGQFVSYSVKVNEEWLQDGVPMVIFDSYTFTASPLASNILLNRNQVLNFDWQDYKVRRIPAEDLGEVLINKVANTTFFFDDIMWIHVVGIPSNAPRRIQITEYNAAGASENDTEFTITATEASVYFKFDGATFPWEFLAVSFGIRILDSTDDPITNEKRFALADHPCSSFDQYRFIYLDQFGSYIPINLDFASSSQLTVEKRTYRRRIDPLTDNSAMRGTTRYYTDANDTLTANTSLLNADDIIQVEDLIQSPNVFLDVRNNDNFDNIDFVPVEILTDSIQRFKPENQEIIQYSIQFRFAFEKTTR